MKKENKFVYKKIGNLEQLKDFIENNGVDNLDNIKIIDNIFNKEKEFDNYDYKFLERIINGGIAIIRNEKRIMSDIGYNFIFYLIFLEGVYIQKKLRKEAEQIKDFPLEEIEEKSLIKCNK